MPSNTLLAPLSVQTVHFLRLHISEETARNAADIDLKAFKEAFPDAEYAHEQVSILHERYADQNAVGCLIRMKVRTDVNTFIAMNKWLMLLDSILHTGKEQAALYVG